MYEATYLCSPLARELKKIQGLVDRFIWETEPKSSLTG
jgi:hypothetical protein